ncbi:killer toxin resistant protein [Cryptotrichosporon argae]
MRWAAVLALAVLAHAAAPPLSISLETSWPAPPLALEILETVADEAPSSYFPLLRLLATHLPTIEDPTPASILALSTHLLETHALLAPDARAALELGLALHVAAPRIEAAYAWYGAHVDEGARGVGGCASWVEWRGKAFCAADELRRDVEHSIDARTHHLAQRPEPMPFDRASPCANPEAQAVLYYAPSAAGSELIDYLARHAAELSNFQYIVRYRPPLGDRAGATQLAGFGVEMALKKTDYLVVDDRATGGQEQATFAAPATTNGTDYFADVLGAEPWAELSTPLSPRELQGIPLQAASLIMASSDPLTALVHLAQDFPKYSATLARRVAVSPNIQAKAAFLARRGPVAPAVFVNGRNIKDAELNAFSLLRMARAEKHLVHSLTSLGLTQKQAFELISDPLIGQAQTEDDPLEGLVDASDRPEDGRAIVWLNDLEKDERYAKWPAHVQGYLRPLYPGQLHNVRRNTWNVVLVLDLAQASSLDTIAGQVHYLIQRGVPLHLGVVPMFGDDDDLSRKMAKTFLYTFETFGPEATRGFLGELVARTPQAATGPVDLGTAKSLYATVKSRSGKEALSFDDVLARPDDGQMTAIRHYLDRLVANKADSPSGHIFVNGKHAPMVSQWTSVMQQALINQLNHLQETLHAGYIVKGKNIATYFYDLPTTAPSRNVLVVPSGDHKLRTYNLFDVFASDATRRLTTDFMYNGSPNRGAPITFWVVGDLDSPDGYRVIRDALRHLQAEESACRLGFVHTPSGQGDRRLSTVIYHLLAQSSLALTEAADLECFIQQITPNDLAKGEKIETPISSGRSSLRHLGWGPDDLAAAQAFWEAGTAAAEQLGLADGQPHLLVNGRLVGPLTAHNFGADDFDTLELYELRKRAKPVIDLLSTMYDDITVFDKPTLANLIAMSSSVVAAAYRPQGAEGIFVPLPGPRTRAYEDIDDGALSFTVGDPDTALLHVAAVFDPVSEQAQRWSAYLRWLSALDHVAITVYLDPNPQLTELQVKRFYRSSLSTSLLFDVDGNEVTAPVVFSDLPAAPIYTLALDTPPSWLVRPKSSPLDLDNLLLSSLPGPTHIPFDLASLVIDGHARDGTSAAPRGIQLELDARTSNGTATVSDTQVMANLGYLQLRAPPGVYDLAIRPGRGREVYDLESAGNDGWESPAVDDVGARVTLSSFEGKTLYPRFARRKGMETADVLQEPEDTGVAGSVFSKMKSLVGLSDKPQMQTRHADINIFTVASGLLYERFASIMILSVLKHTKSSVKFWFIENFLSPTFIEFLPHFSEAYGFEYELVTYKWPSWLRAQTEKQRIIWAYKILFLDVLFPMDLDKVIFVDADQIVRTDMKELVEVDLHGRVYGYPPMGDSRTEMEGFRFWKTGYWKDVLRGRPYHISALYIVDLKRFRQLATGDRLRGQYHALSADPNSLANLDQDLPNSMQDQIPIWTLDQDWLWCQTWCSDESLATAKTIDLCQNPLTKEPKLARARQIPEWDSYDREVAAFAAKLSADGGALAIDVDALAASPGAAAGGLATAETHGEGSAASESREEGAAASGDAADVHMKDEL